MNKEWPDVPALLEEAREWAGSYASWGDNGLVDRLADALETVHDLYKQADTAAVNLIAEKDELQARVRELHQVDEYTAGHTIVRCVCEEMWPCSTIRALEEEQ